ncbi:MAG: hypothetical protein HN542_11120 [Flavobacteriales bacterium]|nr:hypothetical protein [Flavobacteriales bacterium]MBT6383723.1 hypothetical protein [Flavobacteriales bacterium]NCG30382.1 hypothetical protein [Bacteroidota bacterium]
MEALQGLIEIIITLIPAAAIVGVVYVMLKQYFDNQEKKQQQEWNEKRRKEYLPMQIQAYERFILYLERIHPERLVFRNNKPGMSARLLQADMLKIMREEFDHNLAQQLYISSAGWESVKAAREETFKILNKAAENVHKDSDSMAYSTSILELCGKLDKLPTELAIEILKKEFRKKLNG